MRERSLGMTQLRSITITAPDVQREPSGDTVCYVCSKAIEDERCGSDCRNCNKPIHVAWAQNQPEPACSRMALTPMSCGVSFVCMPCFKDLGFA